jgi:hypothetical protein
LDRDFFRRGNGLMATKKKTAKKPAAKSKKKPAKSKKK